MADRGTLASASVDVSVLMAGFDRSMATITRQLRALGTNAVTVPVSLGLVGGLGAAQGMRDVIGTATSLETMMVALRKATDVTDDGMAALKSQLYGLSTSIKGVSLENLLLIATTGAKMGIAAGDLAEYAAGVAKVATAMDDMPAGQIADEIGKLNVIFRLGVQGTLQFGSAIDKLADSGVSSASGILNVSQRISGAAVAARMTAQQTVSLSAALLDTGTHSELAASSISHMIQKLNSTKGVEGFAKVLGKSTAEIKAAAKADGFGLLLDFLDKVKGMDAGGQNAAFGAIGIKGDQGLGELQKLAMQTDTIRKYVGMANNEFRTLNQINQSYALTAGTTAAATEAFSNQIKILKDRIGSDLLPVYGAAMSALSRMTEVFSGALGTIEVGMSAVMARLGQFPANVAAAVGPEVSGMVTYFAELWGHYFVENLEFAAKVIRNLPDYMDVAALMMMQKWMDLTAYVDAFMENLQILGHYVVMNWSELMIDGFNAVGHVIINLGKNLAGLAGSFVEFLKDPTQGFNFDWTPLLEGFKKEAGDLPEMMAPKFNSIQGDIDAKLAEIQGKEDARKAAAAAGIPALAGGKDQPKPAPAGEETMEGKKAKEKKEGGFTSLEGFYQNLQMAGSRKDPTQDGILKNTDRIAAGIQGLKDAFVAKKPAAAVAVGPA